MCVCMYMCIYMCVYVCISKGRIPHQKVLHTNLITRTKDHRNVVKVLEFHHSRSSYYFHTISSNGNTDHQAHFSYGQLYVN